MRTIIILFVFLMAGLFTKVTAQEDIKEFKLDFLNKEITKNNLDSLKEGDFYKIIIDSLNTYLYKVTIESRDTIIKDVKVDMPSFGSFGLGDLTDLLNVGSLLSGDFEIQTLIPEIEESLTDSLLENIKSYSSSSLLDGRAVIFEELNTLNIKHIPAVSDSLKNLDKWQTNASTFNYVATNSFNIIEFYKTKDRLEISLEKLEKKIKLAYERYKQRISIYLPSLMPASKSSDLTIKSLYENLLEKLKEGKNTLAKDNVKNILLNTAHNKINAEKVNFVIYQEPATRLKDKIDSLQYFVAKKVGLAYFIQPTEEIMSWDKATVVSFIVSQQSMIKDSITRLEKELRKGKKLYLLEMNKFKSRQILDKQKELLAEDKKIENSYEGMFNVIDSAKKSISAENINDLIKTASAVVNNNAYSYESFPIQLNGDQTEIRISVAPKDSTLGLQSYTSPWLRYPRFKKSPVAIGSSFYLSGLFDEVFSKVTTISFDSTTMQMDTTVDFQSERATKYELGMFINLNFLYDFGKRKEWSAGVSFGPGISFTRNIRPRLLGGLSVGYGNRSKIMIGFGGIAGYVERASQVNSIKLNQNQTLLRNQNTVSKLEASWFAHIGYFYRL
ncbi:MAG: hypothetical protein AAFO07_04585 [Bacteroidota bacterium]